MTNKTYDIWYLYDSNGCVVGFEYSYVNDVNDKSSVRIYYEKDLQGNLISLLDARGAEIAKYFYDAWGNITDSMCYEGDEVPFALNHITYRSYYRDNESGFYYLQSRYYDSEICRFINADDVSVLGIRNTSIYKDNLYCYCNSDPVNSIDPEGKLAAELTLFYEFVKVCIALLGAIILSLSIEMIVRSFKDFCETVGNGMASIAETVVQGGQKAWGWSKTKLKKAIAAVKEFTTVVKADVKIRNLVRKKSKTRYWSVILRVGYVDIGRPLTYSQAVKEVSYGRNVFTVTKSEAKAVAKAAGSNKKPVGPEIDKGKSGIVGYYYHYHIYNRAKKGHVWYLF